MSMSAAVLAAQLQNMTPSTSEAMSAQALANAWGTYFDDADGFLGDAGSTAKNALKAALSGMSTPSDGANKMAVGFGAFWGVLEAAPGSYFAGCIAIVRPAGIAGLAAVLQPTFNANTSGGKSLADATADIAGDMHAANLGGTKDLGAGPVAIT